MADIERPTIAPTDVLVRVAAASVNPADFFTLTPVAAFARMASTRSRSSPAVVGTDFAGTVEAVGNNVRTFKVGDEVFGGQPGAFAEYVRVAEHGAVVHKPANVTMEQAAAAPIAGVTALQAVRDHGRLQPGQNVLINGASGGVGTFSVQIARALGGEVTAVCSTSHVETVRAIGAQHVVDYTREDFTRLGQHFDLLLDIAGSRSFGECERVLAPKAIFMAVGSATHMQSGAWKVLQHVAAVRLGSLRSKRRFVIFIARTTRPHLLFLQDVMASGKVTPVIDKRYPLSDVQAAFAYLGQGHAAGKVVLDVAGA